MAIKLTQGRKRRTGEENKRVVVKTTTAQRGRPKKKHNNNSRGIVIASCYESVCRALDANRRVDTPRGVVTASCVESSRRSSNRTTTKSWTATTWCTFLAKIQSPNENARHFGPVTPSERLRMGSQKDRTWRQKSHREKKLSAHGKVRWCTQNYASLAGPVLSRSHTANCNINNIIKRWW